MLQIHHAGKHPGLPCIAVFKRHVTAPACFLAAAAFAYLTALLDGLDVVAFDEVLVGLALKVRERTEDYSVSLLG